MATGAATHFACQGWLHWVPGVPPSHKEVNLGEQIFKGTHPWDVPG